MAGKRPTPHVDNSAAHADAEFVPTFTPASAPTMTINPLSAIAPGILRRFVDPLGGVPAQRLVQPGQAQPRP